MPASYTVRRRILWVIRDKGIAGRLGGHLIKQALEGRAPADDRDLRLAGESLENDRALKLYKVPEATASLEFTAQRGERFNQLLDDSTKTPAIAAEVVELLCRREEDGQRFAVWPDIAEPLDDLSEVKLKNACLWLDGRGLVKCNRANGGYITTVWIEPEGRAWLEELSERNRGGPVIHQGDSYHVHVENVTGSNLALLSPSANQTLKTSHGMTGAEVAAILTVAIAQVAALDLDTEIERRVTRFLEAAQLAAEEPDPDPKFIGASIEKAMKCLASYAEAATRLGTQLAPVAAWAGLTSGTWGLRSER